VENKQRELRGELARLEEFERNADKKLLNITVIDKYLYKLMILVLKETLSSLRIWLKSTMKISKRKTNIRNHAR
jgi:hypothetical protein